jgi:hypothetical protein
MIKFLKIFFISIVFSLLVDFFFGRFILNKLDGFLQTTEFYERLIRINHPVYHHTLSPNVDYKYANGINFTYRVCTNNHGFKSKCNLTKVDKNFDVAFMGDSFVEGGLEYEKTFVGIFEDNTNLSVANLGVISYAPKIYLSKLKYLLDNNFNFKHVILFVDISDFYDDSNFYIIDNNYTVSEKNAKEKNLKRRRFLRKNFPFTNFYLYVIKRSTFFEKEVKYKQNTFPAFSSKVNLKSLWSFSESENIEGYDLSLGEGKKEMVKNMTQLYELLKKNNIKLSVAVYPWPQQLLYDKVDSLQVEMWRNFCLNKCENFINFFPLFFEEIDKTSFIYVYKKYYFFHDVHFNANGNKLIAEHLIKNYKF